jgi:serralysin
MLMKTLMTPLLSTLFLAAVGCTVGEPAVDGPLTYDQFRAQASYDPETKSYVINGDELVADEAELEAMYNGYLQSWSRLQDAERGIGSSQENLLVNQTGTPPRDDRWAAPKNLTYCINTLTFGANAQAVTDAMAGATADWEAIAGVNFTNVPSIACSVASGNTFAVRFVSGQSFLARAFFPSMPWYLREIQIDASSFGAISPFTLRGILRHELGHVLGFRHEHTRPESGKCFEDNNWRPLTAYDASSVMHYPQCNGANKGDLVFSNLDRAGARALYP